MVTKDAAKNSRLIRIESGHQRWMFMFLGSHVFLRTRQMN